MKFKIKSSTPDCASTSEPLSFEIKSTQSSDSPVVSWNDIIGKPSCFNPCTPDGDLLSWNSTILAITNGENKVESDVTFSLTQSSSVGSGYLSSTDWNTFNDKFDQPTGSTSDYIRGDGSIAPFPSFASTYFAQGGNTFGTDANLGTNDNFGLNFKTNNTTRGGFSNSGVFTILNLTSANAGIVKASTGGALSKVDLSNTTTDYLGGDGAFHPLPSSLMLTFQNGINNNLGVVRLGGPLTTNTNITTDGFSLTFTQAFSRSLVIGDDGSLKANASTTNPGFQYSPTFYNSGAGIGISALGTAFTPAATLHVRSSSNLIGNKVIKLENTDTDELFSVKDNGEGFLRSNLLLTTGSAIKASNQVTTGAMLINNGTISYINNSANTFALWDFANSKFVINAQGRAIFGVSTSSSQSRVYIEGYSTGSIEALDVRDSGGVNSRFHVRGDGVSKFNGSVGINISGTPLYTLDVEGSVRSEHSAGFYSTAAGITSFRLYAPTINNVIFDRINSSTLTFAQNGGFQARLDSTGGWTVYGLAGASTRLATVSSAGLFGTTTPSAFGLVETSRLLNINGVSQSLAADRSWRTSMADTGALTYAGISVASATTVNIGACTGIVVDNETDPLNPTYVTVTYAGETNKVVPTIGSATGTYVLLRSDGVIHFQTTYPTSSQRKTHIYLSKISHPNLTSISFAIDEVDFITSPTAQFRDLFQAITYINTGVTATPNANLTIANTAGTILGNGIRFVTDRTNGNNLPVSSSATTSFLVLNQSGATGSFTTAVDPVNYDVAGVTTPVGGGTLRSTLQYLWYAPGVGFALQRGQTVYDTLVDAIAAVGRENFVIRPNLVGNSILIGVWAMRHTTTNLSDTTFARFFPSDKFGQVGGSSSGISTATFQTTYNNSSIPQILLNAQGAFTIRNSGSYGADTLALQQWQNTAGTTTASINGNGLFTGSNSLLTSLAGIDTRITASTSTGLQSILSGTGVIRMAGSVVSFDTTVVTSSATPGFIPYMSSATNVANSPFFYDTAAFTVTGGDSTLINGYNFIRTSSATDVRTVASFYHKTTSTPAIGLGGRIGFGGSDSAGTQVAVAAIGSEYEVITAGNTSGALVFFTSTGGGAFMDRGRITGAGLWGIGKTPGLGALLDVNGATKTLYTSGFYLTNGTTMQSRWYQSGTTIIHDRIATTDVLWQQAATTQMWLIGSTGNLGVGITPNASAKIHANGAIWAGSGIGSGYAINNSGTVQSTWNVVGTDSVFSKTIGGSYLWQHGGGTQMNLTVAGHLWLGAPISPTARLHVKSHNTTLATSALIVENSAGTVLTDFKNDGTTYISIAGKATHIFGDVSINSSSWTHLLTGSSSDVNQSTGLLYSTYTLGTSNVGGIANSKIVAETSMYRVSAFASAALGANPLDFANTVLVESTVPINIDVVGNYSWYQASTTLMMQLDSNGNLGLGDTADSTMRFYVKSLGTTSSTYAYYVTNASGTPAFLMRDDLKVGMAGQVTIGALGAMLSNTAKLCITGETADSTANALFVQNGASNLLFAVRNDGRFNVAGSDVVMNNLPVGRGTASSGGLYLDIAANAAANEALGDYIVFRKA